MANKGSNDGFKSLNVLEHELVPKMVVISDSQKSKLLEELKVSESNLPEMDHGDSASVALGAKVGDVVKIYRNDPTGKYFYYRIII